MTARQWDLHASERHLTDRAIVLAVAAVVVWKRAGFGVRDLRARVWRNSRRWAS